MNQLTRDLQNLSLKRKHDDISGKDMFQSEYVLEENSDCEYWNTVTGKVDEILKHCIPNYRCEPLIKYLTINMAESSKKRKSDEGIEPSGKSVQTEDQFIIVGTDFTKDPLLQPPQGDMTRDTDIQDMKNKLEWMEKVSKDIRESLIRVSFEMERLSFLKLEVERLKEHAKLYNQYKNWLEMKLAMYKK